MGVKLKIFVSLLISSIALVNAAAATSSDNLEKFSEQNVASNHPLTLNYLGLVDGKAYFVEANVTKNWTDAKTYCEASNLKLASIETKAQLDFLDEALSKYGRVHYYTSARETRTLSMLLWDGTDMQPNTTFIKQDSNHLPINSVCGIFIASVVNGNPGLCIASCNGLHHILCQTA